jgi:hypothetical protein
VFTSCSRGGPMWRDVVQFGLLAFHSSVHADDGRDSGLSGLSLSLSLSSLAVSLAFSLSLSLYLSLARSLSLPYIYMRCTNPHASTPARPPT